MVMKKIVSFIAIGVYLTLTNYCLAYSIIKGEAHDPYKSAVHQEKESASEPNCHGHEETSSSDKSSDDHHGSEGSDTCCVKLTKCLESTVPQIVSVPTPKFYSEKILATVPSVFIDLHLSKTWLTNHGPPGVTDCQGFLLSSPSRSPPSPLS